MYRVNEYMLFWSNNYMSVWHVIRLIYGNDKVIKFFVLYLFLWPKGRKKILWTNSLSWRGISGIALGCFMCLLVWHNITKNAFTKVWSNALNDIHFSKYMSYVVLRIIYIIFYFVGKRVYYRFKQYNFSKL